MAEHKTKTKYDFAYDEGVKRIKSEASLVLARLVDNAVTEWSRDFEAAKANGKLLELTGDRKGIQAYIKTNARKALR